MDDRIGTQLGNYRLLQLLGQGGFADVYLSEHIHLHTQAAIKVLQLRLIESNVQSFLNEARTIAHLVHPYIIRVLDFGVQDNVPYLVMDYAPKGTFRQRFLNGQRLPATPLFPYIKQAAVALQYAHDKKLIHRDVKPENMLLGPNDEVLLSDFGFALIQSSNSRTSMETAGTAAYMAPEQLQGRPRPASDQYALAVIAYEWLTGSCPFQGTFFEIASQHMLTAPTPLREKVPSLSPEIEDVIMTALVKDPDLRFPTVRDFAVALERACLAAKPIRLDEPLVPPPFLSEPYKPMVTTVSPQQISTIFPSTLAEEKKSIARAVRNPFEPLSSAVFQSIQPETLMAHGGTSMNSLSLNGQSRQSNQSNSGLQAGLNRPDGIRRPTSSGNAMSSSELDTQMPASSIETNPTRHNLSQSGLQPLPSGSLSQDITPFLPQQKSEQEKAAVAFPSQNLSQSRLTSSRPFPQEVSQSGQYSLAQQHKSLSGIRPLPAEPNPLAAFPSQNLSQSRLSSWPSAQQASQSGQYSLAQQHNSLSGLRPLSPGQFAQSGQSSLSFPTGPVSADSNLQPSLSENRYQLSTQSNLDQNSNRVQSGAVSKQQSGQGQRVEFRNDLQRYRKQRTPTSMIVFVVIMAIFIIGGGAGLIYWSSTNQSNTTQGQNENVQSQSQDQVSLTATASASLTANASANTTATAIANINPYVPGASTLVMDDPLSANSQSSQWQENTQGTCQFTNGSYHASAAPNLFTTCFATATNYTNFTYEIQMVFIQNAPKYSSGGIVFRSNSDQHQFYFFEVYASGRYAFQKCDKTGHCTILAGSPLDPPSPAYHVGQANTVAVVANQNTFTLYINQQPVGSPRTDNDSPYTQGMIGVLARGGLPPAPSTEVAYSNAKVW